MVNILAERQIVPQYFAGSDQQLMVLKNTITVLINGNIIGLVGIELVDILVIADAYALIAQVPVDFPDIMFTVFASICDPAPGPGMHMKIGALPVEAVHVVVGIEPFVTGKGFGDREDIPFGNEIIEDKDE